MVLEARVAPGRSERTVVPATVLICNGDPIVGRALELLLRTADYTVKYVADDYLERPGTLEGVRLLLLGAGWDARSRAAVVQAAGNASNRASISILELGEPFDGSEVEPGRNVPWPCRTEDLTRRIEAIVFAEPQADVGV